MDLSFILISFTLKLFGFSQVFVSFQGSHFSFLSTPHHDTIEILFSSNFANSIRFGTILWYWKWIDHDIFDGRILGGWLEVDVRDLKKQHHSTSTLSMLQFCPNDGHGHGCLGQNMKYNMVLAIFHDLVW